ncbi:MAG TPA: monovalent cation/H+ antiporter subunit D family protein [Candidatus Marinimicrobia bacterium]|jgi:multicomponent Na+:H+ antiporter subunit D|nr:monovalent cation/H+ antiporter subunit D family protein [Candidatus Neomarinimicrobiota bacterium]MDP7216842.1 monovalent cation/H+ antiporter subunit D family protein [Candidatus Neomarinimicrobiota bacterium]HBN44955.1 cation:proton antiporter [Candidatus Neomarinimicrobiota bacterium]HJL73823.1 monovalent cation/H+ antiporter subunit D family protein [Candidatus Neomarinimicrobiota bacterium]HJM69859.1 monovalent cation/H+ antiporter subunit D family protein [Candidatus Neomarinimicrobio|tara:strand:- start:942 stop:2435 length:1494 start_codon:yes stop_codon:yes gene_type:complete
METIVSIKPLLAVLVSTVSAFFIIATRKNPNFREAWSIFAGVLKLVIVLSMIPAVVYDKTIISYSLFTILPGIEIGFKVDAFGLLFAMGASILWIATSFYSIGYMRSTNEHSQTRYFACFAVALSATIGVAFSANLITMFLFYEVLTIITYPLVAHKGTPEARAGGRKYAIYLLGAAKAFLIAAIILTYNLTGTLEFSKDGIFPAIVQSVNPELLYIIFVLFLFGFAKSAVMPFHSWLPAAMVAPTPVSALLHAVAVVKTGVFTILRIIFFVFGADLMMDIGVDVFVITFASLTIIAASLIALSRDNLKARLAFSTISQLSYIILGAALLTPSGMVGGIIHITNHAFSKITLFFCAGSIYVSSHKTKVSQLSGIGKKMPWTMAAFAIATLSMIGIPPVSGFITKWYLVIGALERHSLVVLIVLLVSSFLNAAYFVPILYRAFFKEENSNSEHLNLSEHKELKENAFLVVPLTLTAIISVVLGLYPDFIVQLAEMVIK